MRIAGIRAIVPLVLRPRTRAGWVAVTAVAFLFGGSSTLVLVLSAGHTFAALPLTALLAGGYLWLGFGALEVARCRKAELEIGLDRLTIVHDGLLREPILVDRTDVEAVSIDLRPTDQRRVASTVRRGGIARPSFLDPRFPVVSAAASSHSLDGTAVVPNLVIFLRRPMQAPKVPSSVRLLLRLSQGRSGRYRGPRSGAELRAIRVAVTEPHAAAEAFTSWGVLTTLARDERYLAPIRREHREKALRRRVTLVVGVAAIVVVFGALEFLARR